MWLPCRQIDGLLRLQSVHTRARRAAVGFWLFNPFTATISSRGSGEALVTVMLLHMLLSLFRGAPHGICVLTKMCSACCVFECVYWGDPVHVQGQAKRMFDGVYSRALVLVKTHSKPECGYAELWCMF
jgi:hypothetical protein